MVDADGRLAGIFGEREFIAALFPGYVGELQLRRLRPQAHSTTRSRSGPPAATSRSRKHMNTEHVDVPEDVSDVQVAETFLHHRVLIVPVADKDGLKGVITRGDFFTHLAERFLEAR